MSFREKNLWIYAFLVTIVSAVYFFSVAMELGRTAVGDIAYQPRLLGAIGAVIALSVAGTILAAIVSPREADKTDERDRHIDRLGESLGFMLVGFLMLIPLGLAMTGSQPFWIANTIYGGFVVSTLVSTAVKVVAYRRGL
jgi:predicted membrane protein